MISEHLFHLSLSRVSRKFFFSEMGRTRLTLPRTSDFPLLKLKHSPGLSLDVVTGQAALPKCHKSHFNTGCVSDGASCTQRRFKEHSLNRSPNFTAINENYTEALLKISYFFVLSFMRRAGKAQSLLSSVGHNPSHPAVPSSNYNSRCLPAPESD